MRKIFTLLFLFAVATSFGQSIKLTYNSQNLRNGDTLKLTALSINDDNYYHLGFFNTSNDTIKLQVKQAAQVLSNASVSYCFNGECLDGDLSVEMMFAPGDTVLDNGTDMRELKLTYLPRSNGVSLVKYTFLNNNVGYEYDSVAIYIQLATPQSSKSYATTSVSSLNAYPNPASSQVTIQYKVSGNPTDLRLVVKNLMGAVIYTTPLSAKEDRVMFDVSNLTAGFYVYSIEAGKSVLLTKKLVVK